MARKNRKTRRPTPQASRPAPPPASPPARKWPRFVLIAGVAVISLWWLSRGMGVQQSGGAPGQVWSEEHGHWHNAATGER